MGSFRIRFVLGLVALSLGHVSGAMDIDSIFFRHYSGGLHNDFNIKQVTHLIPLLNLNEWTVFHIHGFTESVDEESVTIIMNAYVQHTTYNVIAIDYRKIVGNVDYIGDAINADTIGEAMANAVNKLVAHGLDSNKIHVIGHSLGGQVAAHVGSHTNFILPRITGLDPAGPMFYSGRYLKSGDAQFVDIIHTDKGFFGQVYNSGDADFLPNGGHKPQPGCPIITINLKDNCDHHRSWRYYAESVKNPNGFMGIQCTGNSEFNLGKCNPANVVPMGFATPTTARGKFYLRTNSQSPFAKGLKGLMRSGLH